MNKLKDSPIKGILLLLYLVVWQIMTIVYWIEYSNDHSFWDVVFFGFFVAEIKGFFWIFSIW